MEGVLFKWTNYITGWQSRWFVLDSGVLSYYKSQEDVVNGSKGYIKIAVCDIRVHPTDNTRLDLIIPGEQHYHVKAAQTKDRQSWLIALGSAKARYSQSSNDITEECVPNNWVPAMTSELRLYCDLLMQQVHAVKLSIHHPVDGEPIVPDIDQLTEATSLLDATCDTFIRTLVSAMQMVQDVANNDLPPSSKHSHPIVSNASSFSSRFGQTNKCHDHSSVCSSDINMLTLPFGGHAGRSPPSPLTNVSDSGTRSELTNGSLNCEASSVDAHHHSGQESGVCSLSGQESGVCSLSEQQDVVEEDVFKDAVDRKTRTFFSLMPSSFADVCLSEVGGIPVDPFLEACKHLLPVFDKLHRTAMAPVKMDLSSNIQRLCQKQKSKAGGSDAGYISLQEMVLAEVILGSHKQSQSATNGLLWLKRSLEFIQEFLRELCSGSTDLIECVRNAYGRTLKKYHGWVVRGVFGLLSDKFLKDFDTLCAFVKASAIHSSPIRVWELQVAIRSLPYRSDFIRQMSPESCDANGEEELASSHRILMTDIEGFLEHLDVVVGSLNDFYLDQQLDFPLPV